MSKSAKYLVAASALAVSLALSTSMPGVSAYAAEKTQVNTNSESIAKDNKINEKEAVVAQENSKASEVSKTQAAVASDDTSDEATSIQKINDGKDDLTDYLVLKVKDVNADNLAVVQQFIKNAKTQKGADLTKTEILEAIDKGVKTSHFFDVINTGYADGSPYNYIGATGITSDNLPYVNEALKGKNYRTLKEIQDTINAFNTAITNISQGTDTVADYKTINVDGVTEGNLKFIRIDIKILRDDRGRDLAKGEIRDSVLASLEKLKAMEKANNGTATLEDYKSLGITGVTIQNLSYINICIRGSKFESVVALQSEVNVVVNIYDSILRINKIYGTINLGTATVEDYDYIGVAGVTKDNITFINAGLKGKTFTTSTDVQVNVTSLVNTFNTFARINSGEATVEDYKFIGATGVTEDNLAYVNLNIKGNGYFALENVQARIDASIKLYPLIARINLGEGSLEDYKAVGAVNVNVGNLSYVNADLKGKNYLTDSEIKARIEANMNVYKALIAINSGKATVADYTTVGATEVNKSNIIYVNRNMAFSGLYTVEQVRYDVYHIAGQYEIFVGITNALNRINLGTATVEDYECINVTGVTSENLIYVNEDLKGKNYSDSGDIQVRIDAIAKIYNCFIKINNGTATLEDYTALGITTVTSDNLIYVNEEFKGSNPLTIDTVERSVSKYSDIFSTLVAIRLGEATAVNYENIGVTDLTTDKINYLNNSLKGNSYTNLSDVQMKIYTLSLSYAENRVVLGQGTVQDFQLLKVNGVTEENIKWINDQITKKKIVNLTDANIAGNVDKIQDGINRLISIRSIAKYEYNGHSYGIIDTDMASWTQAEAYCESLGGHLVTINSKEEQDFINTKVLPNGSRIEYAIGLEKVNGVWKWVTDEALAYTNWNTGEPNLDYEIVGHLYKASGTWNNVPDNWGDAKYIPNYGILCEWD